MTPLPPCRGNDPHLKRGEPRRNRRARGNGDVCTARERRLLRRLFVLLGAAGLVCATGCDPTESTGAGRAADVVRHSATVSEANALIAEVRVSLSRPARVFVEYDNPVAGRYRTALAPLAAEHAIPIVRLRAETTYEYTVFTVNDSDVSDAARGPGGSFTTGVLPASFAPIFTTTEGRSSQPLILTDYAKFRWPRPVTGGFRSPVADVGHYVFLDETGALVWYLDVEYSGAVARVPGQENFVFMRRDSRLSQFTPLGEVTDLPGDFELAHHEVAFLDAERVLMPISQTLVHDDPANDGLRTTYRYDTLGIWHSATGRIEQMWNAKETWDIMDSTQHWMPRAADGTVNWTHINSVTFGPRGNIVLSSRNRNQVISLDPNYNIEWLLHGPNSDYEFPNPADRFHKQHTASQLANGNILLFDNGKGRPDAEGGLYSRALELRLDDVAGTAVKVWEYRADPDVYAPFVSSAYRLNNGNTLVTFGVARSGHGPVVFVEADANGDEVFRVETVQLQTPGQRFRTYRAYAGIEAILGETMLRPPTSRARSLDDRLAMHYERMPHVATGLFEMYLQDGLLVYAKEPCAAEDIALPFFLHVHPKERKHLSADRREAGFDNLDFKFAARLGRGPWPGLTANGFVWQGRCHAELQLPEYEIDHIRTGQFVAGADGSPASASWHVEIRLTP